MLRLVRMAIPFDACSEDEPSTLGTAPTALASLALGCLTAKREGGHAVTVRSPVEGSYLTFWRQPEKRAFNVEEKERLSAACRAISAAAAGKGEPASYSRLASMPMVSEYLLI